MIWALGTVRLWGDAQSLGTAYSFPFGLHGVDVHLDAFFCCKELAGQVIDVEYLTRTYSDLNPLLCTYQWSPRRTSVPTWRLDPTLLDDPAFRASLGEVIHNYWLENAGTASLLAVEWEVLTAVVQGHCISNKSLLDNKRGYLRICPRIWER